MQPLIITGNKMVIKGKGITLIKEVKKKDKVKTVNERWMKIGVLSGSK